MTEDINYNRSEIEFTSVEGPLNMYETTSNKTTLKFLISPGAGGEYAQKLVFLVSFLL